MDATVVRGDYRLDEMRMERTVQLEAERDRWAALLKLAGEQLRRIGKEMADWLELPE